MRDDGLSYGDYVEQLTFLLFLKMAEEQSQPPFNKPSSVPKGYDWPSLLSKNGVPLDGDELETHYRHVLETLGKRSGMLGVIFRKAQNKIQDPAKLRRLIVDLIDKEQWTSLSADVKGDAYEGLLHGIGGDSGSDSASGTGVPPVQKDANGRDARSTILEDIPVTTKDALAGKHGEYEIVLANPPFGKKSSVTIVNDAGDQQKESLVINRDDFWASTSNKQLNFLQHIFTILKQHGRAAVVLPDNVLFEGGAGETIRRELLKQADVHTLLRLPTGIFYAQGVKANVLFFDRKPAQEKPWTQKLWIYDLRTNKHFTLKESTLQRTDLDDFVACWFGNVDSTASPAVGRAVPSAPKSGKKGTDGAVGIAAGIQRAASRADSAQRPTGSRNNRV